MSTKALEPELDAVSLQALVAVAPRGLRGDDLRLRYDEETMEAVVEGTVLGKGNLA